VIANPNMHIIISPNHRQLWHAGDEDLLPSSMTPRDVPTLPPPHTPFFSCGFFVHFTCFRTLTLN
jgi:hypothetical protein